MLLRRPRLSHLRRGLLAVVLLLGVTALTARAQDNTDGSLYSRLGLGELGSVSSSRVEAMGGNGLALRSLNYLNFENPASWSDQVLTRASVGFQYQGVTISDAAGNTSRLTAGSLHAVQFGFPLLDRRLGVGLGFLPFSRVSYRVRETGSITEGAIAPNDSIPYNLDIEGGGGLQQIVGGLGYRLLPNLSVGADVEVILGIIESARRTTFPNDAADYAQTNLVTSTRLVGVRGTFGAIYSASSLLGENDLVSVGATFTLPTRLYADRARTLGESLDRDTLGTVVEGSFDLPLGVGLGLAYQPDARWSLTAGASYQPWSQFSGDLDVPGFTPGGENRFADRQRASIGIEFVPAGADLVASYFARAGYRLGFYYDQAYVNPIPDTNLRTLAVTGGLSLPTLLPGTRLDVNLEVGTRGTTDGELVRDVFYRLTASVNIGERWFQNPKLR